MSVYEFKRAECKITEKFVKMASGPLNALNANRKPQR